MTITVNDVAKKTGVSVATVSRVINDSALISEKIKINCPYSFFSPVLKLVSKSS